MDSDPYRHHQPAGRIPDGQNVPQPPYRRPIGGRELAIAWALGVIVVVGVIIGSLR